MITSRIVTQPLRIAAPAALVAVFGASTAAAQEADPAAAEAEAPAADAPPAKPKKAPYSLPWQLRPVVAGNVVRLDTAYAMFENKQPAPAGDASGTTMATMLLFSYKVMDNFAPLVRVGHVTTKVEGSDRVSAFINPVVGGTYSVPLGDDLKLGLFLGIALPFGQGGGERPADPNADTNKHYAAAGSGIYARSAMDNAMFAVNYLTVFPGAGVAYVKDGLTLQAEATVLSLNRARGGDAAEVDKSRWNFTTGLHVGYFFIPMLSAGVDLRYQRWLSTPKFVEADEDLPDDAQRGVRDQATFAVGPRFHFQVGDGMWLRPGIAYARGIDKPMSGADTGPTGYNIIHVDVPFAF